MKRAAPLALLLLGCASRAAPSPTTAPASTASATATATPAATATASEDAPGASVSARLPTPALRQLVDAWLRAQNDGDFAAYSALYAERFEGVKRAGGHVAKLDRARWIADRGKMFGKKMVVSVADLGIYAGTAAAQIHFTQTWESGSFKDHGDKQLLVVREAGGLRIAKEEMLASVVDGATRVPPLPVEQLALAIQQGGTRLVLREGAAGWAKGAPTLLATEQPAAAREAADMKKVPTQLGAWVGQRVQLYGDAGLVCEATVSGLAVVARAVPHFGTAASWKGLSTSGDPPKPPPPRADVAAEIWEMATTGSQVPSAVLTAELGDVSGDCGKALWGRVASSKAPVVAPAEAADAALRKGAVEAFRQLAAYREIQGEAGAPPVWDAKGTTTVLRVARPGGKPLVLVTASTVVGACGDFRGDLFAVFEVTGEGAAARFQLAGKPGSPLASPLRGAVDADGDGRFELLFQEATLRGAVSYDQLDVLTVPSFDCEC